MLLSSSLLFSSDSCVYVCLITTLLSEEIVGGAMGLAVSPEGKVPAFMGTDIPSSQSVFGGLPSCK